MKRTLVALALGLGLSAPAMAFTPYTGCETEEGIFGEIFPFRSCHVERRILVLNTRTGDNIFEINGECGFNEIAEFVRVECKIGQDGDTLVLQTHYVRLTPDVMYFVEEIGQSVTAP